MTIDALIRTPVHSLNSRLRTFPFSSRRLFLVGLSLGCVLGTLLPLAKQSLVASCQAQLGVGTTLNSLGGFALLDLVDTLLDVDDGQGGGEERDGLLDTDVLAVTSLGLTSLAGEDDEALLVGLEAGDVGGERLLADVLAAGVDGNTDSGSEQLGDTSGLVK